MGPSKSYYVCTLADTESKKLRKALVEKSFDFRDVPYAQWGAYSKDVNVVLYSKGKTVIQGKGTADFVQYFLEPEILKRVQFGYEALFAVESGFSHIGVDESGKGDYFGPLVIGAVFVEKEKLGKLCELGVKDSKTLSEKTIEKLNKIIRGICPYSVVVIGPEKYNELYGKIKNLNRLLAWGHARAIENLLLKVDCQSVVIDQFGKKELIHQALLEKGKKVEVQQMHRGERDLAVAAASIVARQEFVNRLTELGRETGTDLPRGAGNAVKETAVKIYHRDGLESLSKVAKIHFKTTNDVVKEEMKE